MQVVIGLEVWGRNLEMNIHAYFYGRCMFSLLLGIFLGVKLLGDMVAPVVNNLTAKLSSKAAVPFYTPTSNVGGFQGLHILTTLVIIFFKYTILERVKWYFMVGFLSFEGTYN